MNAPHSAHRPRGAARGLHVAGARVVLAGALLSLSGCTCGELPQPDPDAAVGQLSANPVEGGFELVLSDLERPVRSLQVDVKLNGANATGATNLGGSDVLEAGLAAPKNDFTVVVSDTRRLNLPTGALVRVDTDAAPGEIVLTRALAIDDSGALRTVLVVVP